MSIHDPAHAFVPYPAAPVPHAATGPLAGLYFAAKDLFDVAGYPTGGGNPIVLAMSGIKTTTAPTVQRLLDAGACFVGKALTDESAFSMNGNNAHFGAPINGAAPRALRMPCIAGMGGLPQLSLPLAGRDGAPMGLSLVGPPGNDGFLVGLAEKLAASMSAV